MITPTDRTAAHGGRPPASARRALFAGFATIYLLWLVLGIFDTLVWMPQYIAPTTPLNQIYHVLTDAGSVRGVVLSPVLWLLFWATVGAAYVIVFLPAHPRFHRVVAAVPLVSLIGIGLIVFGAMAFFQWWSGFAMGMEVSDDLPPGVGASTRSPCSASPAGSSSPWVGARCGLPAQLVRPDCADGSLELRSDHDRRASGACGIDTGVRQ